MCGYMDVCMCVDMCMYVCGCGCVAVSMCRHVDVCVYGCALCGVHCADIIPGDTDYHGTSCAGTAFARKNSVLSSNE